MQRSLLEELGPPLEFCLNLHDSESANSGRQERYCTNLRHDCDSGKVIYSSLSLHEYPAKTCATRPVVQGTLTRGSGKQYLRSKYKSTPTKPKQAFIWDHRASAYHVACMSFGDFVIADIESDHGLIFELLKYIFHFCLARCSF